MILTSIAILLTGLTACAQPAVSPAEAGELKSEKPRITSPSVSGDTLDDLVSDNSAFALDLYQQLKTNDGNLFYSPYSISLALAISYAVARDTPSIFPAVGISMHNGSTRLLSFVRILRFLFRVYRHYD